MSNTPNQPREEKKNNCCQKCLGSYGFGKDNWGCIDKGCPCHHTSSTKKEYNHPNLRCIRCDKQLAECKCPELETRPVASPLVPEGWEENDLEKMYVRIEPLVEEMKAKYPKECNIEGLEPALRNDIAEIALIIESQTRNSVLEELPEEKIIHSYMETQGDGHSKEYCEGWNDYRMVMINQLKNK